MILLLWLLPSLYMTLLSGETTETCVDPSHSSSPFCQSAWNKLQQMSSMNTPDVDASKSHQSPWKPFGLLKNLFNHGGKEPSMPDFKPIPLSFSLLERYKALARLQYISYCPSGINDWTCGICNDKASPLKNTTHGAQFSTLSGTVAGIVGVSHDFNRIFVAFQGALRNRQWARCFQAGMRRPTGLDVKDPNIFVHSGFYKSYMEIRGLVLNLLTQRRAMFPLYKILILGHSYGGGISGIMALDVAAGSLRNYIFPRSVEWITFGSPRVGNHEYAHSINSAPWGNQARLVHSTDIIAHVPPRARKLRLDYLHTAGQIWLNPKTAGWVQCDNSTMASSPLYTESKRCANSVPIRKYSMKAHISYTTKRAFDVCPYQPMSMNVPVDYLPDYIVDAR